MRQFALISLVFAGVTGTAVAAPPINEKAPDFTGISSNGETVSLDQFEGRNVVLEWTNHDCPFVRKHYETGNMQLTQNVVKEAGDIWISVISSAPGKQGHVSGDQANALSVSRNAHPDYVIIDESGEIGRAYGAKTTPHMFVINADGTLKYDGAVDDKPSANHATVADATNFVLAAYTNISSGNDVDKARTKPYGCSVKYGS